MTKALVALVLGVALVACHRKVNVSTAPAPVKAATFRVTNNLTQPVNIYVTSAGSDVLAGQVPPNSTQVLSAPGVAAGTTVSLKARTVDGTRTYSRDDVVLASSFVWQVP